MLKEFKEFAMRGNVLDMAVGIIIGAAFGKIVTSFVGDILIPPIGLILGKVDFSGLFLNLSGKSYSTLADAKAAGAATLNYGLFINTVIDFLIVAFVIFLLVRQVNRWKTPAPAPAPATKDCPYCFSAIPAEGHALPELHFRIARLRQRERNAQARLAGGNPPRRNFTEMIAQTLHHFVALTLRHFPLQFGERKMHDVVVMDFFAGSFSLNSSQTLCSRSISFGVRRGACGPR